MIKQFRVVIFWWQRWDDKENIAPSQYEDQANMKTVGILPMTVCQVNGY